MPDNFEIAEKIPAKTVLTYIDRYWGLNETTAPEAWKLHKCANRSQIPADIAAACAFLSDKEKVIARLQELETALVARLENTDPDPALKPDLKLRPPLKLKIEATKGQARPDLFNFKTHKVLSGVLDEQEQANGFNGATATLLKLHTEAEYAEGAVKFDSTSGRPKNPVAYNPDKKKTLAELQARELPKGAPTLTGLLLKSFNPVLLKNGYHWKDPGAGDSHGEFTHRLQWYALTKAWQKDVPAANAAYEVFTAMGFLSAGGGNPAKGASGAVGVYLWEMVCDCFQTGTAEADSGKPWATGFNCPDVLNAFLSSPRYNAHPLPFLHALMRARREKRNREANAWLDKILTDKKNYKFAVTSPKDQGNIVWHKAPGEK